MNSPATHSIAVRPGTAPGQETTCELAPPAVGVPAAVLPARPLTAGVRATKRVPSDPEILRRVRAALDRL
jgi:hypothetical protein